LIFQVGDHTWAHSLLQESNRRTPDQPDVLYDLALAQYSLGRISEAMQTMQQALGSSTPFSQTNAARWFLTLTDFLKNPAQASSGESQVQQLLKSNPNYVPALMVQGILEEQRGNYSQAKTTYEKAQSIYPSFLPATKRLAALYSDHLGDDQRAYDLAFKARSAHQDDAELAKLLGKIACRRKDYSYAFRLLQESTRKLPNDAEAFYYLGLACYHLKQPNESKQALRQAIALKADAKLVQEANRMLAELQ
jgi:Flp pilus assembly protein TadD